MLKTNNSKIQSSSQIQKEKHMMYFIAKFESDLRLLRVPNLLGIRLFALLHGPKFGRE